MPRKKKKTGKAYFVKTTNGVYPLSVLDSFEKISQDSTGSQQIKDYNKYLMQNGLVDVVYPGDAFLTLYESNTTFFACVNQTANDVAGLGWYLHLKPKKDKSEAEFQMATDFLSNINPEMKLRQLFKELLVDLGTIGYIGIEVTRDRSGKISKLYRVPAHTIRVHESKEKYCQLRNTKKVWFSALGADKISTNTGKKGGKPVAHEMVFYRNSYPKSDYYGVPNIICAIGDVVGLISSRDYNINFFTNYGVPTAIIVLSGEWSEEAEKNVEKFFRTEVKGVENAHRALVLSENEDCKVEIVPLDTEVKEASFQIFEQTRKENILTAYSMPPERIGVRIVGELGGNVAAEATKTYISGVVDPLQRDMEDIVNRILSELGVSHYEFKFKDVDIRDTKTVTEYLTRQVEHGIRSPNEARLELGLEPYAGGDQFYLLSTLLPVNGEILPATDEEINSLPESTDAD